MPFTIAPMPVGDELVLRDRTISEVWRLWFRETKRVVDATPERVVTKQLTAQTASIATTSLPLSVTTGLWRVSWAARITRAATTSSSLTVTIGWTDTVALTSSGAALTGNTTTTSQSGMLLIAADGNTPMTYATTYASAGATTMQYKLDIVVERVNA